MSLKCRLGIHDTGVDGTTRLKLRKKGIREAIVRCKQCKKLVNIA